MDSPYTPLEFSLLNDWQRDFPVCARPFAELAAKVGADETAVLDALKRLQARGAISRVGAVLAPRRIGASTQAALAAPVAEIERIARVAGTLARQRQRRITSVDKANVLETSRLWRAVVERVVHSEFPDCSLEHMLVD